MSKKTRGALAAVAAGAITLTVAPNAFAAPIDPDPGFVPSVVNPGVHRIAAKDRISTAIEASQTRSWGHTSTKVVAGTPVWQLASAAPGAADVVGQIIVANHVGVASGVAAGQTTSVTYTDWTSVPPQVRKLTFKSVKTDVAIEKRDVDIIIARSDDYADAIAATPMADILNAPVLINPTASLDDRVKNEIKRLAATATGEGRVRVHLLGGTNALSHDVENAIDGVLGNSVSTFRYQGIDRFQTATTIANATLFWYGGPDGVGSKKDLNVYLTTGRDFADALSAGPAAANNDGIVLLTDGDKLDRRGFTDDFLVNLRTIVNEAWKTQLNTSEIIAVGGPSARAAANEDIRLAKSYVGADRFATAALTARGEFKLVDKTDTVGVDNYAVVSGVTYADALVASSFIANADGPLLLSRNDSLPAVTKAYLVDAVDSNDRVFTFGGPGAMAPSIDDSIKGALNF